MLIDRNVEHKIRNDEVNKKSFEGLDHEAVTRKQQFNTNSLKVPPLRISAPMS